MGAIDYTDGGGWSKLDQTGADELARVVGTFRNGERLERVRMLFTLYRCITPEGVVRVSYERLADLAGVSYPKARRFMGKLERDGVILPVEKTLGEVPTYRFSWHSAENPGGIGTPPDENTGRIGTPPDENPGGIGTIKRSQTSKKGRSERPPTGPGSAWRPTRPGKPKPKRPDETALDPRIWTPPPPDRPHGWDEDDEASWLTPPPLKDIEY